MGKTFASMMLHCDSNKFDMKHDHVLKKLNFEILTPVQGSGRGAAA